MLDTHVITNHCTIRVKQNNHHQQNIHKGIYMFLAYKYDLDLHEYCTANRDKGVPEGHPG